MEQRYVIGLQLFVLYIFMYSLSLIIRSSHLVRTNITAKQTQSPSDKSNNLNEENFSPNLRYKNFVNLKNRKITNIPWAYFTVLFVVFITCLFLYSMWNTSLEFYSDIASQIATYYE